MLNYSVHGNELGGSSGTIASPMFPHSYRHIVNRGSSTEDVEITWRVTVSEGKVIRITFDTFELFNWLTTVNEYERCSVYLAVSSFINIFIIM